MSRIFKFEIEHVFAESLYNNRDFKQLLERFGFAQQSRLNQVALFSDAQTIANLQQANPALISALETAGWGINRHDQRSGVDAFQKGKNDFLKEQLNQISMMGDNLVAQKFALLELFDWTRKLALGQIKDGNGTIIPVQSQADIYSTIFNAQKIGVERFANATSEPDVQVKIQSLGAVAANDNAVCMQGATA